MCRRPPRRQPLPPTRAPAASQRLPRELPPERPLRPQACLLPPLLRPLLVRRRRQTRSSRQSLARQPPTAPRRARAASQLAASRPPRTSTRHRRRRRAAPREARQSRPRPTRGVPRAPRPARLGSGASSSMWWEQVGINARWGGGGKTREKPRREFATPTQHACLCVGVLCVHLCRTRAEKRAPGTVPRDAKTFTRVISIGGRCRL